MTSHDDRVYLICIMEIDMIAKFPIEILARILWALTHSDLEAKSWGRSSSVNPLKDSVIVEHDLTSPIEASWDAEE